MNENARVNTTKTLPSLYRLRCRNEAGVGEWPIGTTAAELRAGGRAALIVGALQVHSQGLRTPPQNSSSDKRYFPGLSRQHRPKNHSHYGCTRAVSSAGPPPTAPGHTEQIVRKPSCTRLPRGSGWSRYLGLERNRVQKRWRRANAISPVSARPLGAHIGNPAAACGKRRCRSCQGSAAPVRSSLPPACGPPTLSRFRLNRHGRRSSRRASMTRNSVKLIKNHVLDCRNRWNSSTRILSDSADTEAPSRYGDDNGRNARSLSVELVNELIPRAKSTYRSTSLRPSFSIRRIR